MGGKFKFQVQDNDLEYYFGRFDKHIALSEKKLLLTILKPVSTWIEMKIFLKEHFEKY